jgi:hypothetical protein
MKRGQIIKKLLFACLLPLMAAFLYAEEEQAEEPVVYETNVVFRDFPWGTSIAEFIKKMGKPISREEVNGLVSLAYENIEVNGFTTYMLALFSKSGLEAGTYYFVTNDLDELMRCYNELRQQLRDRYGPTYLFDGIIRERRPYECSWDLPGGYVHLKVNTRQGDPVTLWVSSPALTNKILGPDRQSHTAKK